MILKPQDILILLKQLARPGPARDDKAWSYAALAHELGMSASEVHAGSNRLRSAGLLAESGPVLAAAEEFLLHGLKYVFVPERGALVRGMPTAHAASPLNNLVSEDGEPPPVWPDPEGSVRGMALEPLYKSAPQAARNDSVLYEWLVLVDALRAGRARERKLAADLLSKRLQEARYEP